MGEFELLKSITIGQYLPTGSILHLMDSRAKLLSLFLLIVAVSITQSYEAHVILLAVAVLSVALGRIPMKYAFQGIWAAAPLIIVLAAMQLLFYGRAFAPQSHVLWEWRFLVITEASLRIIFISIFRFVELILLVSTLTFTTTTTQLTHGIENLLSPLQRLRFPAHDLALVVTIALRFVPTLAQEADRVMKAQAARGATFGTGSRLNFIRYTKDLLPIIVPLFFLSLRRANEMVLSMEVRCYAGGKGRTKYIILQARQWDYLAVGLVAILSVFVLLYPFSF